MKERNIIVDVRLRTTREDRKLIIKNDTQHVVVVTNGCFSKEIAIGEDINISREEISGNYDFEFSFFSLKKEKSSSELKAKRGLRGLDIWLETESNIPLITKTNVKNCEKITLSERSNTFLFMYCKIRITNLKSIAVKSDTKRNSSFYFFSHPSDKMCFLRRMIVEGLVTLLLSALLFIGVYAIRQNITDTLVFGSISACFLASAIRKLVYMFKAMRWKNNKIPENND